MEHKTSFGFDSEEVRNGENTFINEKPEVEKRLMGESEKRIAALEMEKKKLQFTIGKIQEEIDSLVARN